MSTRDNYTAALYQQSLKPQTIAASALNSGNVDTQGYESLSVAILVGDISETLGSGSPVAQIDLKIEHAADDGTGAPGTYAACVDADVLGFTGLTAGLFKTIDTGEPALCHRLPRRHASCASLPRRRVCRPAAPSP